MLALYQGKTHLGAFLYELGKDLAELQCWAYVFVEGLQVVVVVCRVGTLHQPSEVFEIIRVLYHLGDPLQLTYRVIQVLA